jgi:hypothetical protein
MNAVRPGPFFSPNTARDLALIPTIDRGSESFHATDTTLQGRPLILEAMNGSGSHELVQILLQAHGDANQIDQEDVNQMIPAVRPIVYAASFGLSKVITTLVDYGADPLSTRKQDNRGLVAFALVHGEGTFNVELKQALELTSPALMQRMDETCSKNWACISTLLLLGKACLDSGILAQWIGQGYVRGRC